MNDNLIDVLKAALEVSQVTLEKAGDLFTRLIEHDRTDPIYDECDYYESTGPCPAQSVELARLMDEIRAFVGAPDA